MTAKEERTMRIEDEVKGTLREDGTLELDHKPELPPGRVLVTIRYVDKPPPVTEDWWTFLQRKRAELEASGHQFMTEEEVKAYIADLRSGDERIEEVYRQVEAEKQRMEEERLQQEQKEC
jgi:hypothetical protein